MEKYVGMTNRAHDETLKLLDGIGGASDFDTKWQVHKTTGMNDLRIFLNDVASVKAAINDITKGNPKDDPS